MRYAAQTAVASDKSRGEIEHTLSRYGATGFMYGWAGDRVVIGFQAHGRNIKFMLPMPDRNAREFTHTAERSIKRHPDDALKVWEQAGRQRWRALALVIKAKLEAVQAGITVFEDEFMAHIVLPSGETVGEYMAPQIESAYKSGKMPPLLPWHGDDA